MNLVKNEYVIIFDDRSNIIISQEQHEQVLKVSASNQTGMILNGNYYKFNSISKIISLAEYYDQYPEKRPEYSRSEIKAEEIEDWPKRTKAQKVRALREIKRGFLSYFENKEMKPHQQEMIKKMDERITLAESLPEEEIAPFKSAEYLFA